MSIQNEKTIQWVKIIAIWSLFCSMFGIFFFLFSQLSIIDETLTTLDYLDFCLTACIGLLIFIGLWNGTQWGWKIIVVATPLTWIYNMYDIAIHYESGMGLFMSIFLFIDFAIIRFLFKEEVLTLFDITSKRWAELYWIKDFLLFFAIFLIFVDLWDGLSAFIIAVAIVIGIKIHERHSHPS
ncbi:MAG: hypothetical protein SVW57_00095 [Thermodesulfobacteriota bacterium]|nr:hypothetical protein [Thermodesulfobacteriota bacterium]